MDLWDLQQLRLAPRFLAFLGLCADAFHGAGFDRTGRMTPFSANVGQNRGDLVIVENAERRHVELKRVAFDVDGAVQAVQHDAHESLWRGPDPRPKTTRPRPPPPAPALHLLGRGATPRTKP